MTFSEKAKSEILSKDRGQPCCQIASLSAFIRGAGTIATKDNKIGFEITTENYQAIEYYKGVLNSVYGVEGALEKLSGGKKYRYTVITDNSLNILTDLGILTVDDGGVTINLGIDKYLVENDCCKQAYIQGAFIGSGSLTVPSLESKTSTSYHLEFVFSKYQTAFDFTGILSEKGFMPKQTERKQNYIVYFKNGDEISELLFFMGATKCCFEVKELVIEKDIRNETNRRVNCEMANIDKQINASNAQINNINVILQTIGVDKLSPQIKEVVSLRLDNPESSLEELSKISGLSKSCLNHRFRKISEMARNL